MQDISDKAFCNVCTRGVYKGTREAYIELIIGGRSCICLLDTGSDMTLSPSSPVKGYKLVECSVGLHAANGTSIPILGTVTVKVLFKGKEIIMDGLVTDHV